MKIDFNNVRRQACFAYDRLIKELNESDKYEGYLLVDPDRIEKILNDLRMTIGAIAMCHEPGSEDVQDVYSQEYPEGKGLAVFENETDEE